MDSRKFLHSVTFFDILLSGFLLVKMWGLNLNLVCSYTNKLTFNYCCQNTVSHGISFFR